MTDTLAAETITAGLIINPDLQMVWDGDRASFAKAFVAAQKGMEAVKKAATNPHFKTKYADLSEVVEATVPALNGSGIGVIQSPAFDGEWVRITTMFLHESGASLTGVLSLKPTKADPQGVGSAITYGRRYALQAMTGAAPEDDDANAASAPRDRGQPSAPPRELTLADRADALATALKAAKSADDLEKTWAKGAKLCADLSTGDAAKLAEVTGIYDARKAELAEPFPGGTATPFDQQEAA